MSLTFLDDTTVDADDYPGGEVTVRMPEDRIQGRRVAVLRGADPGDLLRLAMWGQNVHRLGGEPIAVIPYLPAARADHGDRDVGFDALVYAQVIEAGCFHRVVCIDPHSLVMPSLIGRCDVIPAAEVFHYMLAQGWVTGSVAGVIAPDKGAVGRATAVAEVLGLPVYRAGKRRDFATGKLSGFEMIDALPDDGEFIVVDDICDGGGTFAGLAAATGLPPERLHLYVTHGIFSGRAPENLAAYGTVATTDSHPGHENIEATVVPIMPIINRHLTGGPQ